MALVPDDQNRRSPSAGAAAIDRPTAPGAESLASTTVAGRRAGIAATATANPAPVAATVAGDDVVARQQTLHVAEAAIAASGRNNATDVVAADRRRSTAASDS